jgi:hypothetical protein
LQLKLHKNKGFFFKESVTLLHNYITKSTTRRRIRLWTATTLLTLLYELVWYPQVFKIWIQVWFWAILQLRFLIKPHWYTQFIWESWMHMLQLFSIYFDKTIKVLSPFFAYEWIKY